MENQFLVGEYAKIKVNENTILINEFCKLRNLLTTKRSSNINLVSKQNGLTEKYRKKKNYRYQINLNQ